MMRTTSTDRFVSRARFSASDRPIPPDFDVAAAMERRRPRRTSLETSSHDRSATAFVGAVILAALATVSALTLIAAAPPTLAVAASMLLMGGLSAGILVIRSRPARRARAYWGEPLPKGGSLKRTMTSRPVDSDNRLRHLGTDG
jgi:Flp pilus assembly protein TadB